MTPPVFRLVPFFLNPGQMRQLIWICLEMSGNPQLLSWNLSSMHAVVCIIHVDMFLCELHLTMWLLSRLMSVISQSEEMFNKLEWKSAGPIIEQSMSRCHYQRLHWSLQFSQISNQTNIGIAGIQMRWWNMSAHHNVRIWTIAQNARK